MLGRKRSGLLVSVRSVVEAEVAWQAGASVIDIKEPQHGPLGSADPSVWQAVRQHLPESVPLSIALGELVDQCERERPHPDQLRGISYYKVGPAGLSDSAWEICWAQLRRDWQIPGGPAPIAVAYLDAKAASAPEPDFIRSVALDTSDCAGLLLDTYCKESSVRIDAGWAEWLLPLRKAGKLVAIAGGLTVDLIRQLGELHPALFAVRGAACRDGVRHGSVSGSAVRRLVNAVHNQQQQPKKQPISELSVTGDAT